MGTLSSIRTRPCCSGVLCPAIQCYALLYSAMPCYTVLCTAVQCKKNEKKCVDARWIVALFCNL